MEIITKSTDFSNLGQLEITIKISQEISELIFTALLKKSAILRFKNA